MKLRHYWFSVNEDYLKEKDKNVLDILTSYKIFKKWAFILHDKDLYTLLDEQANPEHKAGTKKKNHFHIYINFEKQSIDHNYVAGLFGVDPNSIKRIQTTAANCLLYFVHGTSDAIAEGKYQYSWSEVYHSSNWSPQVASENERFIGHFEKFSYKEQIEKVHAIRDTALRVKMQKLLDDSLSAELKYRSTFIDRFIQVMFVTGDSGTGKTTFARQFVEKLNYFEIIPKEYWTKTPDNLDSPYRKLDYAISGSSNDAFENYRGEDVYILDDMRDDSFTFTDLLKFLDNHTNSPVKVRFANKCFIGVLLVITSKQPLIEWYKSEKLCLGKSTLKQLYRRISTYVDVKKDKIYLYNNIDDEGRPCGDYRVIKNDTKDYYVGKPKPVNVNNLICNVFNEIVPEVKSYKQTEIKEILDNGEFPF